MDSLRVLDVQCFGGAFTLGAVQAGFKLVGKRENVGGFGVANCLANRELLGDDWNVQACDPSRWEATPADLIVSNPPCSGFSLLSRADFRGIDSPINSCMWDTQRMASRVQPQIVIFESVQQAYRSGLELMQALRAKLEAETGKRWDLYHVLHNAASLGGAAIRRRYFWVASQVPFGIEMPTLDRVPMLHDVIGDLEGLGQTWHRQPYRRPPSWWSESRRSRRGVVDGVIGLNTPALRRAYDLIPGAGWGPKESISEVCRRHWDRFGKLPDTWDPRTQRKLVDNDFHMGHNQLSRWAYDRMARVVTGGGLDSILHPTEDRALTHRECARVQGFPDDWTILPLRGVSNLRLTWGKGIPVDAGRWIAHWAREAIEGRPGSFPGIPSGDRETVIDCTEVYRQVCDER